MPSVSRADFDDPALHAFLRAHLADMEPTAPPESRHAYGLEQLREPGTRVWVAHEDDALVGTVALAPVAPAHEELKSMRTDPALRGRGIATLLLRAALDDAAARGVERVSLETGSGAFFVPARTLYARNGFVPCAPFGRYVDDPNSAYMTLAVL